MLLTPFATCSARPKLTLAPLDLSSTFLKPDREWDGGEKCYGPADGFTLTQASCAHTHTHCDRILVSSGDGDWHEEQFPKILISEGQTFPRTNGYIWKRANLSGPADFPRSSTDSSRTRWKIVLPAQQSSLQHSKVVPYLDLETGQRLYLCEDKSVDKHAEWKRPISVNLA